MKDLSHELIRLANKLAALDEHEGENLNYFEHLKLRAREQLKENPSRTLSFLERRLITKEEARSFGLEFLKDNPWDVDKYLKKGLITKEEARSLVLMDLKKNPDPSMSVPVFLHYLQKKLFTKAEARPFVLENLKTEPDNADIYLEKGIITKEEAERYKRANKLAAIRDPEDERRANEEEAENPFIQGLRERMSQDPEAPKYVHILPERPRSAPQVPQIKTNDRYSFESIPGMEYSAVNNKWRDYKYQFAQFRQGIWQWKDRDGALVSVITTVQDPNRLMLELGIRLKTHLSVRRWELEEHHILAKVVRDTISNGVEDTAKRYPVNE